MTGMLASTGRIAQQRTRESLGATWIVRDRHPGNQRRSRHVRAAGHAYGELGTVFSFTFAPALSWNNIAQLSNITLSQGATVKWSGGDPNGFVTITGVSLISNGFTPGSVSLSAGFVCGERISAGQFTVPSWITSAMPIPGPTTIPGNGAALNISSYVTNRVSIPSADLALFGSVVIIQNNGVTLH